MMKAQEFREKYIYYAVIIVLTLVAIIFLPLIGLDQKGQINFNAPSTSIGWLIWGISKGCICVVNCLIFHFFILQGKDNIKDDPRYIEGLKKLNRYKSKDNRPKSPYVLERTAYMKKGGTLLLTTAMSLFALPSLILQFSLVNFLSVLFSMVMAVAFGVMAMRDTEKRWTEQLTNYVEFIEETMAKDKKPLPMDMDLVERLADSNSIPDSVHNDEFGSMGTISDCNNNR